MEHWLRHEMPSLLNPTWQINSSIIVVGASAGAHLALLTPVLWQRSPNCVLSMYGPTDMHDVKSLGVKRLLALGSNRLTRYPPPPENLLAAATTFGPHLTCIPLDEEGSIQISCMNRKLLNDSLIQDALIQGFPRGEMGELLWPTLGFAAREEIDKISPLYLLSQSKYPPVCQVAGSSDDVFSNTHLYKFDEACKQDGVKSKVIIVQGERHAFDIEVPIRSRIDKTALYDAVEWVMADLE